MQILLGKYASVNEVEVLLTESRRGLCLGLNNKGNNIVTCVISHTFSLKIMYNILWFLNIQESQIDWVWFLHVQMFICLTTFTQCVHWEVKNNLSLCRMQPITGWEKRLFNLTFWPILIEWLSALSTDRKVNSNTVIHYGLIHAVNGAPTAALHPLQKVQLIE